MKVVIEFSNWEEHNAYCLSQAKKLAEQIEPTEERDLTRVRVPRYRAGRRRRWTEYEMEAVRMHWSTKSAKWIAEALGRSPASVHQLVSQMRQAGAELPAKRHSQREIIEH